MHLKNEVLDPNTNPKLKEFKWLPRKSGGTTGETHTIISGELLETLAAQWNTTIQKIRDVNPELESHFGQNTDGTKSWYSIGDVVKRPVDTIDTAFMDSLKSGEVVKVQGAVVKAGELLWTSGMYGTDQIFRSGGVLHWEVFSEENLFPSFTKVEDNDENWNMDSQSIFEMIDQNFDVLPSEWNNADLGEVRRFYRENDNAAKLREYACKFISEWAVDVDKGIEDMKGIRALIARKDKLEPYQWWSKAVSKGVALPSTKILWHYNPLAFVSKLSTNSLNTTTKTTVTSNVEFFIKRGNNYVEAAGPEDFIADDTAHTRGIYYQKDGETEKTLLGRATEYEGDKGLGATDANRRLKKALIDGTIQGIPELDARSKHIWASIWWSEGGIAAINQYDSAFLSFGPIQQTIGKAGANGELGAALKYVKDKHPSTYQKFFGKFGLEPGASDRDWNSVHAPTAPLTFNGNPVNTASEKAEFRKFFWAYLAKMAMEDISFRKAFLEYGFKRITVLDHLSEEIDGESIKYRDVFKSELADALVLDAHINAPGIVTGSNKIWVKAIKDAKSNPNGVEYCDISEEAEYKKIKHLIKARNNRPMTQPAARAAMIVLCCKELTESLVQKLGYVDMNDLYSKTPPACNASQPLEPCCQQFKFNFLSAKG